ncbi:PD-(D/E)XK motif protein [Nitratireductor sp. XY-223]|uniref:PD-(D/E)XK motif protein n=1 Tax=Nitratireductor sp. XY-223 TaxID=2561926 RepID=UPI0010AAAE70|nr:PD-(D/E)XK motif protein [Nitratireductor sp. XY-223]
MLFDLYANLSETIPSDDSALFGASLPLQPSYWLAIDNKRYPALLLPSQDDDFRPDIALRSVEALFSRQCAIETNSDSRHSGCYSLIRLKENDPAIVRLFLKILEEQYCTSTSPESNAEIAARIQRVAALFSRLDDNTRDLVGLWGELHVIASSADITAAVRCWSTRKSAKFDFISGKFVLDVKTTTKPVPQHRFSIEQLRPTGAFDIYIASLCVIEVQGGQTVGSLMDNIATRITDQELRSGFLTQCLSKGGRDLYQSDLALQTYPNNARPTVFRAADIPVPTVYSGDPIEKIRFDVDLSDLPSLSDQERTALIIF